MPVRLAQPRPWLIFTPALLDGCLHGTRYSALVQKKRAKKSQTLRASLRFSSWTPTENGNAGPGSWSDLEKKGLPDGGTSSSPRFALVRDCPVRAEVMLTDSARGIKENCEKRGTLRSQRAGARHDKVGLGPAEGG